MDGWCVLSEWMLLSILSASVDPCEVPWAETARVLAPPCGDLKLGYLLKPFLLMWVFKKFNSS